MDRDERNPTNVFSFDSGRFPLTGPAPRQHSGCLHLPALAATILVAAMATQFPSMSALWIVVAILLILAVSLLIQIARERPGRIARYHFQDASFRVELHTPMPDNEIDCESLLSLMETDAIDLQALDQAVFDASYSTTSFSGEDVRSLEIAPVTRRWTYPGRRDPAVRLTYTLTDGTRTHHDLLLPTGFLPIQPETLKDYLELLDRLEADLSGGRITTGATLDDARARIHAALDTGPH